MTARPITPKDPAPPATEAQPAPAAWEHDVDVVFSDLRGNLAHFLDTPGHNLIHAAKMDLKARLARTIH